MVVAARNEEARIGATVAALRGAFPCARVWVADDCSCDQTARLARAAGACVIPGGAESALAARRPARAVGKGAAMSAVLGRALGRARECASEDGARALFVLCDGDLGGSARELTALAEAVRRGEADLAVGAFAERAGGGFGIARAFARWAIRRRCGLHTRAPISGQRALSAGALAQLLPFAAGYGMELAMTIDAVRAGLRVSEIELDLQHRAVGRTPAGFAHRAAQLRDFLRAYNARRRGAPRRRPSRARNFVGRRR